MKEYLVHTKTYTKRGEYMGHSSHEVLAENCSDACAGILNSMPTVFSDEHGRFVTFAIAATMINRVDEAAKVKSDKALEAGYKARFS